MELRRLSYFRQIAAEGSLSKASAVLGITQPALSRQMRLLEEELGVTLFQRMAKGMRLTGEGEFLREAMTGPLHELELAMRNVRSLSSQVRGTLTLGMPVAVEEILAESLVHRFTKEIPNVKICVVEGPTGSLIDWLLRGLVDVAFLHGLGADERLFETELLTEQIMLVGAADSGLAPDRPVSLAQLAKLPMIIPCQRHGLRSILEKAAVRADVKLSIRFEIDSIELTKSMVGSGMAYAPLPLSNVRKEVACGQLTYVPIEHPALHLLLVLAVRPNWQIARGFTETVGRVIVDEVTTLIEGGDWPASLCAQAD
jgi:LysR family nitrogen assimilation transcriptional regulator